MRIAAVVASLVVAAGAVFTGAGGAQAEPSGSYVEKTTRDDKGEYIWIHSAAMNQSYPVLIQRAKDQSKPRPILYMLAGLDAGYGPASWQVATDAQKFLGDKDVNVAFIIGGKSSYYADWIRPDPKIGVNKWKTYLTEEAPPLLTKALNGNGVNAIAGLSTSGTSVLSLAQAKPGLFRSVAAYSGCAQISDPLGHEFVRISADWNYGANVDNMYGTWPNPMWVENDPVVNAERLRGLNLYISSGLGLPGSHDNEADSHTLPPEQGGLPQQIVVGGVIEAATNVCSRNLQARLNQLGIPATYNIDRPGTHSWGYWEDALHESWPVLARGLGIA